MDKCQPELSQARIRADYEKRRARRRLHETLQMVKFAKNEGVTGILNKEARRLLHILRPLSSLSRSEVVVRQNAGIL